MELIYDRRQNAETLAAAALSKEVRAVLANEPRAVIGVPGGTSVAGVLSAFALTDPDWNRLDFFLVDERLVPLDDPMSNYRGLADGPLSKARLHPVPVGDATDHKAAVQGYEEELSRAGGGFHIVLLGVGEDGHVASLFPGSPAVSSQELGYLAVTQAPKPPPLRVTASPNLLKAALTSLVFFFGSPKLGALERFLSRKVPAEECPAKLVLEHERSYLVTDLPLPQDHPWHTS